MPTPERLNRIGTGDKLRVHLVLWVTLVLLVGVTTVFRIRISLRGDSYTIFGKALVDAGEAWLQGTLPVLLAGGFAICVAFRRAQLLLAICLVLGSTAVEVVGYAAWSALATSSISWWREAIYALSTTLLAGAWLTARAWGRPGLLASPLAGIASLFAVPHFTAILYHQSEIWWGYGTAGQFIGTVAGLGLEVLVLSVPAAGLIALRWARTASRDTNNRSTAGIG